MGNAKVVGIRAESKSSDFENDRSHFHAKSATTKQEKVALRVESKYSLARNVPNTEKCCTEKLRCSDSAKEFGKSSSMNMIKGDIKMVCKETNGETSGQFMEWIKLRGAEQRPRNKMEELSNAHKLKCWNWRDNEMFLDKESDLILNETESDDQFEPKSKDLFSFVDSDSCFEDEKSCEKNVGSFSRLSELSAAIVPMRKVSAAPPDLQHGGADSPTAFWNQDPSSDESVKLIYCFTSGNCFEKGLPKHTEYNESAHRIEFKPSFSSSSTQLGMSGKKFRSPKVLRPCVKVNHRAPVLPQNHKGDQYTIIGSSTK